MRNYDHICFRRSRRKSSPSPLRRPRSRSPVAIPHRDIDYRRASPPNRRDFNQQRPVWNAYGSQPSRTPPQAMLPNSATKRPRSPSPLEDSRYARSDFPPSASGSFQLAFELYTVGARIPNMFGIQMVGVCLVYKWFGFRTVLDEMAAIYLKPWLA